jgi:hypothetical protein
VYYSYIKKKHVISPKIRLKITENLSVQRKSHENRSERNAETSFISGTFQVTTNVQHNIGIIHLPLAQTFRESGKKKKSFKAKY